MDSIYTSLFYSQYNSSNKFAANLDNTDRQHNPNLDEDDIEADFDLDKIFAHYGIVTGKNLDQVYVHKENLRGLELKSDRFNSKMLGGQHCELDYDLDFLNSYSSNTPPPPQPSPLTEKERKVVDSARKSIAYSADSPSLYDCDHGSRRVMFYSGITGSVYGSSLFSISEHLLPLSHMIYAANHSLTLEQVAAVGIDLNGGVSTQGGKESESEFFIGSEGVDTGKTRSSSGIAQNGDQGAHSVQYHATSSSMPPTRTPGSVSSLGQNHSTSVNGPSYGIACTQCFWIDVTDPTPEEIETLSKIFYIHPLTVEDIESPELANDKVDIFGDYTFITYGAIDDQALGNSSNPEYNLKDEAVSPFFIVMKNQCLLSFHSSAGKEYTQVAVKRVLELERSAEKFAVTPSYITYALLDAITDGIEPITRMIEIEVDTVDELVLILPNSEHKDMLLRLGSARRRILTLFRVLQGKPNVIKMLKREFQKTINSTEAKLLRYQSSIDSSGYTRGGANKQSEQTLPKSADSSCSEDFTSSNFLDKRAVRFESKPSLSNCTFAPAELKRLRTDLSSIKEISWFFSDIADHLDYLLSVCSQSEEILSRTHSNHMGKVSLNLASSSEGIGRVANVLTTVGVIATPFLIVGGLFGMNVHVPGQEADNLNTFFILVGFCSAIVIIILFLFNLSMRKLS